MSLTAAQFDALVALAMTGPRQTALVVAGSRLVLVDGLASSVAAEAAGVSRQQLSNVLRRLRETLELARRVCASNIQ